MTKDLRAHLSATGLFLQELLLYPQQIGAVLPSSRRLASAMADWLPSDPDAFVLELGPGTGAVTEALLARGLRPDRLIAVELSQRLAGLLREKHPGMCVIHGDACHLDRLLRRHARDVDSVGAVISSLPLRGFPLELAKGIAAQIRSVLEPGGQWVQYSYRLGNRRFEPTARFDLVATRFVWMNVPPARVNVYRKRAVREEGVGLRRPPVSARA